MEKGVRTHVFGEVHWGLDRKWCICSAGWGLTWKNSATYIILASKWCRAGNFFGHITPTGTVNHKIDSAGCYIPKNDPQVLQNLFLVTQFKQSTQSPQNTYLEKKTLMWSTFSAKRILWIMHSTFTNYVLLMSADILRHSMSKCSNLSALKPN